MLKALHVVALSVLGAIMVHILLVLGLPRWTGPVFLEAFAGTGEAGSPGGVLSMASYSIGPAPFIRERVCPFDFSEGGLRVLLSADVPFFSVAVITRDGRVAFSSTSGRLGNAQSIALWPAQARRRVALAGDAALEDPELQVFVDASAGYFFLRAFEPDPSWSNAISGLFENAGCELFDVGPAGTSG
jgi:uncharacterized membrane protein